MIMARCRWHLHRWHLAGQVCAIHEYPEIDGREPAHEFCRLSGYSSHSSKFAAAAPKAAAATSCQIRTTVALTTSATSKLPTCCQGCGHERSSTSAAAIPKAAAVAIPKASVHFPFAAGSINPRAVSCYASESCASAGLPYCCALSSS